MGAMIALLLVLSTLTACASETLTDVKNALPAMVEGPSVISYAAETETYADTLLDEDGALLASYFYEVPVLRAFREDSSEIEEARTPAEVRALEIAAVFNEQFTDWTESHGSQSLEESAREYRKIRTADGSEWQDGYAFMEDLNCEVYQTGSLVSVSAEYVSYTGGAHPNTILLSWNFDLDSGGFISPVGLVADGQAFSDMVCQELISQLQARAEAAGQAPEAMFWENYQEIVENWSSYTVSFHEDGMTVGFSPYELASYAAGAQEFTLSYEQLAPYLSSHGREVLGLEETGS